MNLHCHHDPIPRDHPPSPAETRLIEDMIAALDRPDDRIVEVAVGSNFVGVRGEKGAGLSSTLGAASGNTNENFVSELMGMTLGEAARNMLTTDPMAVSLGAAALNAGIAPPPCPTDVDASAVLAEKGKGKEVVLVGEFPFTPWLREQVGTLHLFDLKGGEGVAPRDQWEDILARCPVIGLTGTTLLTRAMSWFLERSKHAFTVVIGPTTPMSPALFDHGADMLAGSRVARYEPVFDGVRNNMSFRQFKPLGVEFLCWERAASGNDTTHA